MKFLVYSQVRKSDVGASLGMPEYSYFFVLDPFLPVLATLGDVVIVADPAEVDATFERCEQAGEPCVFICFAPPNKSFVGLRCPTVTVFAWEFDRLPDETWDDDPRNDWRYTLRSQGRAITLSSHSAQVVRNALGDAFDVMAIPVPVYDRFAGHRPASIQMAPELGQRSLGFCGAAFDSRFYEITAQTFISHMPASDFGLSMWSGDAIDLAFRLGHSGGGLLGGFYETEGWGTWSKLESPWIVMPCLLQGRFTVCIDAVAYGPNFGKTIEVRIGDHGKPLLLDNDTPTRKLEFDVTEPQALIRFVGLDTSAVPGTTDPRTMGIGLRALRIESVGGKVVAQAASAKPLLNLDLDGVVYTSVLNPGDDRKNWVDMLTAFCWAFRDVSDATLVLKMTHHSIASFLGVFHYHLQRIGPIRCRIVLVHGFLDHAQYLKLIDVSTYYVNASRCEGLCLPLMEFMSCGVPAVAPCNTAMEDYVSDASVFVVRSSLEPGVWPHDPRNLLRALRYRIDWSSLAAEFSRSYAVAKSDTATYRRMGGAAAQVLREFCSEQVVAEKLKRFFKC